MALRPILTGTIAAVALTVGLLAATGDVFARGGGGGGGMRGGNSHAFSNFQGPKFNSGNRMNYRTAFAKSGKQKPHGGKVKHHKRKHRGGGDDDDGDDDDDDSCTIVYKKGVAVCVDDDDD